MKRFALAWLIAAIAAGTAAAQTAPYGTNSKPDASRVVLRGTGNTTASTPSTLGTTPTTSAATKSTPQESNGDAKLATCDKCGHEWTDCCCNNGCGITLFGEWMLLQPRGADAVFAARGLNCFDPPLDVNQIDFGAFDSFRVGFSKSLHNGCSEIGASFWMFEAQEEDRAPTTSGTDVILPLLLLPSQITCPGSTSTSARASAGIDFDRVAIDYKQYCYVNCTELYWLVGFGYGKLEQDLTAIFDENRVRVDSDLHGYGLRVGGGASRACGWLSGYLHTDFTLLASNVNARFRSFDVFNGKEVDFSQDLDRLVPILDLEVGVAANVSCHTTLKVGYIYSIWWNVVTNQSFVKDVQHGDITGNIGDTLTFDGVFARVEFTF